MSALDKNVPLGMGWLWLSDLPQGSSNQHCSFLQHKQIYLILLTIKKLLILRDNLIITLGGQFTTSIC